ncbi:MFS transporter [Saccharopolyspora oryzae]|uniref:MFS transporter n=1 Tax=Saccharopolyspora oryzae TaxID=2997343 RepID=A0ABT4V8X0_9PSEU|nr:MFS transporter [Saccharopolyspora oryzae]MDA3630412.1 MFS transporter [Saccharopolyspora oryzae]
MTQTVSADRSVRTAGPKFVAAYIAALLGSYFALITPASVTVALRIQQIDPEHKVGALALALGIGALLAVISNPLFGYLSDRTTSRFGMRRPWLIIGVFGGTAGLLVVAFATTTTMVVLGWCLTQVLFNAALAAMVALLPDQIPPERRGFVSALMGVCYPISMIGGSYVAQAVAGLPAFWMFLLPAIAAPITVVVLCTVLHDRRLAREDRTPFTASDIVRMFSFRPRHNPAFAWSCLMVFLLSIGVSTFTTYLVYYLSDVLGVASGDVAHTAFVVNLIAFGIALPASMVGGWMTDRLGRRGLMMIGSAIMIALALVVMTVFKTVPALYVSAAIAGVGLGGYFCGHFAVPAAVLSGDGEAAREMGIVNIALTLPSSLVPVYAPALLSFASSTSTNYPLLFASGVVACLLAIPVTRRIRFTR